MKKIHHLLLLSTLLLPVLSSAAAPDETIQQLQILTNAPGAPGFETPVRNILYPVWKKDLASIKVDGMGNIIGVMAGKTSGPAILLMAHMDEVGFLIRDITKEGFIEVEPLGGVNDQVVYAQKWKIMTAKGPVTGYSGLESGHIIPGEQSTDPLIKARDMFIDVGARSREEAMKKFGLRPGLPLTPDSAFSVLNNTENYLAKALDDRVGLAVMTDIIKENKTLTHPNQISVAATVQEEIGLRGAHVIFNHTKPDIVINLEACVAGDFPVRIAPKTDNYPALGHGPCLYIYDRSMLPNNNLVEWIIKTADANKIPYQFASAPHYSQDGSVLQQSGEGVPVINIGIPVRYAHQQLGLMQRSDYDATVKLVRVILEKMDEKEVKVILNG